MTKYKLLVHSVHQLVQVVSDGQRVKHGDQMSQLAVLGDGGKTGYSILVDSDGVIAKIGPDAEVRSVYGHDEVELVLDGTGMCVLPGLVDAHTHPVWAGDRVHEFAMKLAGATYMEVHKAGGGIHFTVDHTRRSTEDELFSSFKDRLLTMQKAGTTLVECKSGYGLDFETEVKMLKVIDKAKRTMPIGISVTYCGAHAVPKNKTAQEATTDILDNQLPELRRLMRNDTLRLDNIDVFCEQGVFDIDQSKQILNAGKAMGLNINFHGDELHPTKSAEMGASIGALAISHLEEISDEGIDAMATAGSAAVVLPTTAYILRLKPPPARKMIEHGLAVALGSDFNPNAYCLAMPMVMHLACVILHMSMPEALNAATINAAYALNVADKHGSLEVGKFGNFIILNTDRWENLIYKFGCYHELIDTVVYKGRVVHTRSRK